jgi:hypothetical protein
MILFLKFKTMKKKPLFSKTLLLFILIFSNTLLAEAQISLVGQVRTRTELRDGLGNLAPKNTKSAAFTSQRTRLTFGYKWDRIVFTTAIKDVRFWGQDA